MQFVEMLAPYIVLGGMSLIVAWGIISAKITLSARVYLLVGVGLVVGAGVVYVSNDSLFGFERGFIRLWLHEFMLLIGSLMIIFGFAHMARGAVADRGRQRLTKELADAKDSLQSSRSILESVIQSSQGALLVLNAIRDHAGDVIDFEIGLVNHEVEKLLGKPKSVLQGGRLLTVAPCLQHTSLFGMADNVVDTGIPISVEYHHRKDHQESWYEVVFVKYEDGVAANVVDITQRKRIEAELIRAATTDALTGLANRSALRERIQHAIQLSQRVEEFSFAVLFLDFDRFKSVNDSLGHVVGDQLLISIAERLRSNLRAIDLPARNSRNHLTARLGGDEFVVLIEGIADPTHAVIVAERLQEDLARPHRIGGHEVISTASIGVVTTSGEYTEADDILRDADTAMYEAKKSGKARHSLFDESMHREAISRLAIENDLRAAVDSGAFLLEFQPIVNLSSGLISAFEAFIRWPHPTRGVIYPTDFIETAEDAGMIVPIGRWVLLHACHMLSRLEAESTDGQVAIHVNHSKIEMLESNLVPFIENTIAETGIDPGNLYLEITETVCLENPEAYFPLLHELKQLGVAIVLDDLGAGESTLHLLNRFPFDMVKIDRSFLHEDHSTRKNAAFLHAMIDLCHNLGIPVVVTGVENTHHLSLLQALGCDCAQGWLFGKPVPADDAVRRLAERTAIQTAA